MSGLFIHVLNCASVWCVRDPSTSAQPVYSQRTAVACRPRSPQLATQISKLVQRHQLVVAVFNL